METNFNMLTSIMKHQILGEGKRGLVIDVSNDPTKFDPEPSLTLGTGAILLL
jgi:hypothetical protein